MHQRLHTATTYKGAQLHATPMLIYPQIYKKTIWNIWKPKITPKEPRMNQMNTLSPYIFHQPSPNGHLLFFMFVRCRLNKQSTRSKLV